MWLVTWEWRDDSKKVPDPLIAVFSTRKSADQITEYVERHYAMSSCTAREFIRYVNRPFCKASTSEKINDVPHGERIRCGNNPWIYARIVTDLKIEWSPDQNLEILTWQEPPIFRWKDKYRGETELSEEGRVNSLQRIIAPLRTGKSSV
jgi:hypothetical protein